MRGTLGRADRKAKFAQMFSNNPAVNMLARARLLLFASRDVWFTIGLPVFLYTKLDWNFWQVGGFLAIWVIGYGIVQASVPGFLRRGGMPQPSGGTAVRLAFLLAAFPAGIAIALAGRRRPDDRARRRPGRVRRRLRDELHRPLVPDPLVTPTATRSR